MSTPSLKPIRAAGPIRDTAAQDVVLDTAPARRRRRWIAAGAVATVIVALAIAWPSFRALSSAERSVPRERLRLATVERGHFVRDVAVRGRVVAAVKPTVYAAADGTVTLQVQAGDAVAAGDVLAEVSSPELASALEQERATLQRLQSELTRQGIEKKKAELRNRQEIDLAQVDIVAAERELRRAEASWAERIISLRDYEKAGDDLSRARLDLAHAEQNARLESESLAFELQTRGLARDRQQLLVSELERQVAELTLRSPATGTVGDLAVNQHAAVTRNQPLMTVVDLSAFEVEIEVPQEYADDLAVGTVAEISLGGSTHPGRIAAVSPEVQDNQVRGRVRFDPPVPQGLRQNQRVSARLVLESIDDALLVKRGPFVDSGNGSLAYVVEGNLAARRPIRTGASSIAAVEILSGLEAGDTIVISDLAQFEGAGTVLLTD